MQTLWTNEVKDFIHQLPGDIKEVLHMRFERKLSVKDISKEKKWSISKVYTKLNTGLFQVQKKFNPDALQQANEILYPTVSSTFSGCDLANSQNDS